MRAIISLLKTFIWRDIRHNAIRSLLTVIGVALGVAVMLAINLANESTLSRFKETIDLVAGKSNLEIASPSMPDIDEHILTQLHFLWDAGGKFTPVIDETAVIAGPAPDVVQVLGVDSFADPQFRPFSFGSASAGSPAQTNNSIFDIGSVYVGEKLAAAHGLQVGSRFPVLINAKQVQLQVAQIIRYSGPGKAFGGNIMVMDIGPAQELFDMRGRLSRIDMIVPAESADQLIVRLRKVLPSGVAVERPSRRGTQVEKMLAAFQYNLTALSLIALLVGMFVIYNAMSITIVRKRAEIGILRAMGASRRLIFAVFVVQAALLGAAGSAIGVGLGLVFARYCVKAVSQTVQALYVEQPPADITVNYPALLLAFAFGLSMTLLAALAPLLEAVSVAPAEAARRGSFEPRLSRFSGAVALGGLSLLLCAGISACLPAVNGFPLFGYVSAALTIFGAALCLPVVLARVLSCLQPVMYRFFGATAKVAVASLGASIVRTSVTVASLTVGISMMVSLAIMIGSFRQTVIVWVEQTLKADLYVTPLMRNVASRAGRLPASLVQRVRLVPGVEAVDAFVEFPIEYKGEPTNLGAGDLDVLSKHGNLMFLHGRTAQSVLSAVLFSPSCIVSETFALRNNVHEGETLTLDSPHGPFTVKVEAIYYDYASDRGVIVLPRALYAQHYPDTYSTSLGVYLKPGADTDSVRSSIIRALGPDVRLSVRSNNELRKEVLRIFDNTFAITYALHAIAILVAILGVMNALFALTFELRRDLAILTYIGASMRQIKQIVLVQAATLGLLGDLLGMAVGFVLSLLLINVINKQSFGWTVQLNIPVSFLAESFLLVLLFSLLSGWLPARLAVASISPEAVRIE